MANKSLWLVVLGSILGTSVAGRRASYAVHEVVSQSPVVPRYPERYVYNVPDDPKEGCSLDLLVKIGPYSYSPTQTNEFCFVPSKLEFDAHDNLFAILEDNNDEHPYKAYVKTKGSDEFEPIKGLDDSVGVQGLAYDRRSNKIYFATEDGIYVYVLTLSLRYELAKYAFGGIDIVEIDFDKDGKSYIATYKNKKMYTVEEGNEKKAFTRVPNATYFKIDYDGNFYFVVDDYFYVLWADENEPLKISLVPDTGYKAIAFDGEGNGYLAYNEGLLFLKYGTKVFVKVEDLYGAVTSVAIDSEGNLALGYRKKLLKFVKIGEC